MFKEEEGKAQPFAESQLNDSTPRYLVLSLSTFPPGSSPQGDSWE